MEEIKSFCSLGLDFDVENIFVDLFLYSYMYYYYIVMNGNGEKEKIRRRVSGGLDCRVPPTSSDLALEYKQVFS